MMRSFKPHRHPSLAPHRRLTNVWSCRPQHPFLAPVTKNQANRLISTSRKQWLKTEVPRAFKWAIMGQLAFACIGVSYFGFCQQDLERRYGSPNDWSMITRIMYRAAKQSEEGEMGFINYGNLIVRYLKVVHRLEDPEIDGAGLERIGNGVDATAKSEEWRRGYADTMISFAQTSEHMVGWVRDLKQKVIFPPECVKSPANPNPRDPGEFESPLLEDCEPAWEEPSAYYLRIIDGKGFTDTEKIRAGLAYAAWLDYKKSPEAGDMYKWCLDLASSDPAYNKEKNIIEGPPSENLIKTATAYAVHHAQHGDVATALPLFLSALQSQKLLKDAPPRPKPEDPVQQLISLFASYLRPAGFPTPPADGSKPAYRDPCTEASLMTYIGEILFVSTKSKEEGLSWTKDAVEKMEKLLEEDRQAPTSCRECLRNALNNWETMADKLAKEERDRPKNGWFSKPATDRWENEWTTAQKRKREDLPLLETPMVPPMSWLFVI